MLTAKQVRERRRILTWGAERDGTPILTTGEVAAMLGVTSRRVVQFIEEEPPRLEAVRFGRAYIVNAASAARLQTIERKAGRPW